MKDTTQEYISTLSIQDMQENTTYLVNGIPKRIPENTILFLYKNLKVYEAKDISDVIDNYDMISAKKIFIPYGVVFSLARYAWNVMSGIDLSLNRLLRKEFGSLAKFTFESKSPNKLLFFLYPRMPQFHTIHLFEIKFENFETITNPFFTAHLFDMLDIKGNKIKGVSVEYQYHLQNLKPHPSIPVIDIDTIKNAQKGSTFSVTFSVLDENVQNPFTKQKRGKRLLVRSITNNGIKGRPDPPLIMV